jgi:hypothetical protein
MLERILIILALFGAGGFYVYKAVKVKPHRLLKECNYSVVFRSDLPSAEAGDEITCFTAKRGILIATVIFVCLIPVVAFWGIMANDFSVVLYIALMMIPILHTLNEGTKQVYIHQFGIVIKSAMRKKFYPYKELNCLESYNVLNAWHKGISYGYRFWWRKGVLIKMDIRNYPEVHRIETVFEALPNVIKRDF